ncbi:DUF2474 family protein [Vreelandella venusta]|nr:DUF2474 family protein [Halomonas venusta]WAM48287.1 DUF2474 family protein [Halomonas venusta]WAM51772.1 DUF2474 family protein [Halomonas venusta]
MKSLAKRLGWLMTLWLTSVGVLLLLSLGIKLMMELVGLTS